LFTVCCIFNAIRIFSHDFDDDTLFYARLVPSFFTVAGVFMFSSANIVGLFWGEIALKHHNSTGSAPLAFKIYKYFILLSSSIFGLGILTAANMHSILYVVGIYLCFQMFLVCSIGTCLVQLEFHKLKENLPSVQRTLKKTRTAAFKILSYEAAVTSLSVAYTICEAKPQGEVAEVLVHLLLITLYISFSALLLSMGEYLAFMKVQTIPLLLMSTKKGCIWLTAHCSFQRRRVYTVNISTYNPRSVAQLQQLGA